MNPELHLSQLSLTESCKFIESTNEVTAGNNIRERRISIQRSSLKKTKDETKVILEENEPELEQNNINDEKNHEDEEDNNEDQELNQTQIKSSKEERKGWRKYIGLFLTIVHVVSFTLQALLSKLLVNYHPFTLSFWRLQGVLIPTILMLVYQSSCKRIVLNSKEKEIDGDSKPKLFNHVWPLTKNKNWKNVLIIFIRDVTGAVALFTYFYSLKSITIADTFIIGATGPCFVTILAFIFLKERAGIFTMVLIVLTMFGVLIISRPPFLTGAETFDNDTLIGFGFCLICVIFSSISFVLLRYLKHIHYAVISATYAINGTIISFIFAICFNVFHLPDNWLDVAYLTGTAVLTFFGQISLTLALQYEEAGIVSLLKTTNIIFAFIWQFIFLNVKPDLYSLVGAAVVLIGCFGSVFRRWLSDLPQNHPHKKRFRFALK